MFSPEVSPSPLHYPQLRSVKRYPPLGKEMINYLSPWSQLKPSLGWQVSHLPHKAKNRGKEMLMDGNIYVSTTISHCCGSVRKSWVRKGCRGHQSDQSSTTPSNASETPLTGGHSASVWTLPMTRSSVLLNGDFYSSFKTMIGCHLPWKASPNSPRQISYYMLCNLSALYSHPIIAWCPGSCLSTSTSVSPTSLRTFQGNVCYSSLHPRLLIQYLPPWCASNDHWCGQVHVPKPGHPVFKEVHSLKTILGPLSFFLNFPHTGPYFALKQRSK